MDEPTRRAWSRPDLIVVVRGKPEEAVLGGCKMAMADFAPDGDNNDCWLFESSCGSACQTPQTS